MFDNPIGSFADSVSRSTENLSTASTANVPFVSAHYFTSQEYGFPFLGLILTNVKCRINDQAVILRTSRDPSYSVVCEVVFRSSFHINCVVVSGFPSAPNRWVLAMALHIIGFVSYSVTLVFYAALFPRLARNTPRARQSFNVSAAVNEEAEKGLRLDARLSNNERPRTINSRPFTYGISTANPTNAPIVDAAPRPIPSKRIRSRLQYAATKTLPKRSDSVVVEDPGGHERGSCAGQRMSGSLPTAGASSVRDQDVTRPSGRLSNPSLTPSSALLRNRSVSSNIRAYRIVWASNSQLVFSVSFVLPA
ncbi:hypothetical protein EDD22DRAFT_1052845 [Suillus occidentalis]|nr:hypothetical protein EDD22DRAFT_1052845 [Suillus occidentalis]